MSQFPYRSHSIISKIYFGPSLQKGLTYGMHLDFEKWKPNIVIKYSILIFQKVGKHGLHELGLNENLLPNNKGVEAVKLLCEC